MCGTLRAVDRVAYNLKHADPAMVSSSNNPDGEQSMWSLIWKAPVPNKIRVFGWRLASDNLATKRNKW